MEGKINAKGRLEINRAGSFTQQSCPFDPSGISCGNWCPLFGEPKEKIATVEGGYDPLQKEFNHCLGIELEICQRRKLLFDKFTDERIKQ